VYSKIFYLKKTKQIIQLIALIFSLLLISSCSVFQSKYVEIESEDGACFDELYAAIIENRVSEIADSNLIHLAFTIVNTNKTESESEFSLYTIILESDSNNFDLKFNLDNQKSILVEENNYKVYLTTNNPSIDQKCKVGAIQLKKGEKRSITIEVKTETTCETYSTKTKVLRSELQKKRN